MLKYIKKLLYLLKLAYNNEVEFNLKNNLLVEVEI